jgi:hypothetical protein
MGENFAFDFELSLYLRRPTTINYQAQHSYGHKIFSSAFLSNQKFAFE